MQEQTGIEKRGAESRVKNSFSDSRNHRLALICAESW